MNMKSILSPDTSVLLGVANGAIILGIYNGNVPIAAAIRASEPTNDSDIEAQRRAAAWMSAGFLAFMFLLTRDRNSFLIGGLVLAGVDYTVKHGNGIDPSSGKLDDGKGDSIAADAMAGNVYPMPSYDESDSVEM